MIELVFETHSTSLDNEAGIASGWLPGALSSAGREQARQLGIRRRDVDLVFASDLGRAVETAKEAAFAVPVLLDWRLRECDYGALNGAPAAQIAALRGAHLVTPFPAGESYRDVVARMNSFLVDVRRRWNGRRICVIGHSATRWALEHTVHGEPLERLVVSTLEWRPGWIYAVD